MWCEIKDKTKLHALRILLKTKTLMTDSDNFTDGAEIKKQLPADNILVRWRCIIDLFVENEFI